MNECRPSLPAAMWPQQNTYNFIRSISLRFVGDPINFDGDLDCGIFMVCNVNSEMTVVDDDYTNDIQDVWISQ